MIPWRSPLHVESRHQDRPEPEVQKKASRAAEKRSRYRNDPVFREKEKAYNREYRRKHNADPLYRKMMALRKAIWQDRESLSRMEETREKAFRRLQARIKEEEQIAAIWKQKKAGKIVYSNSMLLTPEQRSQIGRNAVTKRWEKWREK